MQALICLLSAGAVQVVHSAACHGGSQPQHTAKGNSTQTRAQLTTDSTTDLCLWNTGSASERKEHFPCHVTGPGSNPSSRGATGGCQ